MEFVNHPRKKPEQAMALVIVLACLLFLAALVLAFLSNVNTEFKSSKANAQGANALLLSQSAVNLALAQIERGTKGVDDSGNTLCWASQPGMIRTYDAQGKPAASYKLYSWDVMQEKGAFDPVAVGERVPTDWSQKPAIFVDLNEPIQVNGVEVYPIVDGNNLKTINGEKTYDSNGDGVADVDGFSVSGSTPLAQSGFLNPIPMPVKWLYVLADGQVVTPQSSTGQISGATAQNPIVGRLGFWTDDETCKVNVNTASEASFNTAINSYVPWDTPRFFNIYDQNNLANSQPFQHEFQRYPGHPATVSLSSVFKAFLNTSVNAAAYPENIYPITPRTIAGGSQGGSIPSTPAAQVLPLRADRLYSSVDEFIFSPIFSGTERVLNDPSSLILNKSNLEWAKFFVTAGSRAPDLNLFNLPRVSIWPVSANGTAMPDRSPLDQLTAFCTTVNRNIFYFQRLDPNDPNTDLPDVGTATGVGRNRQLLEYLRRLTSEAIPGFGGTFQSKYGGGDVFEQSGVTGTERDQILTEIFDYIRSANTYDQSLASASGANPVTTYTKDFNGGFNGPGKGQVVPIVDSANGTRGFGRFPTLQQASLIFFPSKDNGATPPVPNQMQATFVLQLFDPSQGFPWTIPWYTIEISGLTSFTWDGTTPMFSDSPLTIGSPYTGNVNMEPMGGGVVGWRRLFYNNTAYAGAGNTAAGFSVRFPANPPPTSTFDSQNIKGINFTGGDVAISFYQKKLDGSKGKLLQTINLNFPDAPASGFPLPALSTVPTNTYLECTPSAWSENWDKRINEWINQGKNFTILGDHDVVRSVIASPGDSRIAAAHQTLSKLGTARVFQRHPNWDGTTAPINMAHNLRTSYGSTFLGASCASVGGGGRLVPVSYSDWASTAYVKNYEGGSLAFQDPRDSDVTTNAGVTIFGSGTVAGDWDNGVGNTRDGAYINKADEGCSKITSVVPYYDVYNQGAIGKTYFSQNRMMPSAGMLGSLSTGVLENKPWQTLLFRPGPQGHPGLGSPQNSVVGPPYSIPPDHLLLDLFTMPVVEPYAISDSLSTAGRINMNYQIVPFTYVARRTGLWAALKSVQVISVPDGDALVYKTKNPFSVSTNNHSYRISLDVPTTLSQFEARFNNKDIFRAASEICSLDLVPTDAGTLTGPGTSAWRTAMDNYWATRRLTGDNSRERPYTNLYPLLTTKSNTFTVHFRVQVLKKRQSTLPDQWVDGTDKVLGEYRGFQTVERYVDPAGAVPDYATQASNIPISKFYKFRVLQAKQFAP